MIKKILRTKKDILILLCLFFLLLFHQSYAQKSITIRAKCITQDNKVIVGASVIFYKKSSGVMLAFSTSGNDGTFEKHLRLNLIDTLVMKASNTGRITIQSEFIFNKDTVVDKLIVLHLDTVSLKNVTVTAQPIWVRGDTTFFKADFFKDGGERKLADLIVKMPGFEIDEQGNLLYKKKIVEKVMIEGEEIFADKIKLILNNFPVHVLNTVQALEKQSSNKVLKGLVSDNKVFVNLGLSDKVKLKAAFGDGEVGLGMRNRFIFNPVLFSLFRKIKIGYIGNCNSVGLGLDWQQEADLKTNFTKQGQLWAMRGLGLQLINNFTGEKYITNRQLNNQIQVNFPLGKRLKTITELYQFNDKQRQNTFYQSQLFSNNNYFSRTDSTNIIYEPNILVVKYSIDFNVDSTQQLIVGTSLSKDFTTAAQASVYTTDNNKSKIFKQIRNYWNSWQLSSSYTKRFNANTATTLITDISYNQLPQLGTGESSSYSAIFNLPDSGYSFFRQSVANKFLFCKSILQVLKKTDKGLFTNSLILDYKFAKSENQSSFLNKMTGSVVSASNAISSTGQYSFVSVENMTAKRFKAFGKIQIDGKLWAGFVNTIISNNISRQNKTIPTTKLEFSTMNKLSKSLNQNVTLVATQKSADFYQFNNNIQPVGITSFRKIINNNKPIRTLNANYALTHNWLRGLSFHTLHLDINYVMNFDTWATQSSFLEFVPFFIDSITTVNTKNISISVNLNLVNTSKKQNIILSTGIYTGNGVLLTNNQIAKVGYQTFWYNASYNKSWKNKYFVKAQQHFTIQKAILPPEISDNISTYTANFNIGINQKFTINKYLNCGVNCDFFRRNIFTKKANSFNWVDAYLGLVIPKKPLSFRISLNNLTNQKLFFTQDTQTLFQSFASIPLVKTNFFVSARLQL